MKAKALVGAAIAAVIGAVIWGVIAAFTGYEIGIVAWGIGLLVGAGARVLGGEGTVCGGVCAVLALVSIFAGKMIGVQYVARADWNEFFEDSISQDAYEMYREDAEAFAELESPDEYPAFMVARKYTGAEFVEDVTDEDLELFNDYTIPGLTEFYRDKPSYEEWSDERREKAPELVDAIMDEKSISEMVIEDLNIIDVVFAVLGLFTAYKVGAGSEE